MRFQNRQEAGKILAQRLSLAAFKNPIVIALPRGGVPVGYEVARSLNLQLDVLIVRKIGAPFHSEYGIGAIIEGGSYWIDQEAARRVNISKDEIETVIAKESQELDRRVNLYRRGKPLLPVRGKNVIVVDDGLATGVTARVAGHYLREQGAKRIILAVPVSSPRSANFLRSEFDEVICLAEPENFYSVGQFYEDFNQTSDEEVIELLKKAKKFENELSSEVIISGQGVELPGLLSIPDSPQGMVIFAHGSGSGRLSPRNLQVAKTLNEAGMATLLFDLLTPTESVNRANVFDIPFLASRLVIATRWIKKWLEKQGNDSDLPIGYFGASTGGGAALWAAADLGDEISAVVSRGGRPDLAMSRLPQVTAPTLLLVGGWDEPVIKMNQEASKHLAAAKLVIIPEATHVFEEPGKLERVAEEASRWFSHYLVKRWPRLFSTV